jgi:hypothetical protein
VHSLAAAPDHTALGLSLILSHHPLSTDIHHQVVALLNMVRHRHIHRETLPESETALYRYRYPTTLTLNQSLPEQLPAARRFPLPAPPPTPRCQSPTPRASVQLLEVDFPLLPKGIKRGSFQPAESSGVCGLVGFI